MAAYVDHHARRRWHEHVDGWADDEQIIRFICEFISEGSRLVAVPEWIAAVPGCEYYTHQDWPGVVVVFEPRKRHVVTVRVELPGTTRHGLRRRFSAKD